MEFRTPIRQTGGHVPPEMQGCRPVQLVMLGLLISFLGSSFAAVVGVFIPDAMLPAAVSCTAQDPRILEPTTQNPSKSVSDWIDALASPKFAERQAATRALWQMGKVAEKELYEALQSENAEVVARARSILDDFEFGIYPDLPPNTIRLIRDFRDGSTPTQLKAGTALLDDGKLETVIKLLLKLPEGRQREKLFESLFESSNADTVLAGRGQIDELLSGLELLIESAEPLQLDDAQLDLAISKYLWIAEVCDKLPDEIAALDSEESPTSFRLMIRALRANGQFEQAIDKLESASDPRAANWSQQLRTEKFQWDRLSDDAWANHQAPINGKNFVDRLVGMTYHKLTGKLDRFAIELKNVQEFSDPLLESVALDPDADLFQKVNNLTLNTVTEFLFFNGEMDLALSYVEKLDPMKAFSAHVSNDHYERAFRTIGFDKVTSETALEINRQIRRFRPAQWTESIREIEVYLEITNAFYQLGFYEEAEQLYRSLFSAATRYELNRTEALSEVCAALIFNEQEELFFDLIRPLLSDEDFEFALYPLFEDTLNTADGSSLHEFWWAVLAAETDLTPMERLRKLQRTLRQRLPDEKPDDDFLQMVALVDDQANRPYSFFEPWYGDLQLAKTWLLVNDRDVAKQLLNKHAGPLQTSSDAALMLGDLQREDGQLQESYQSYLVAWKQSSWVGGGLYPDEAANGVVALYLAGMMAEELNQSDLAKQHVGEATRHALRPSIARNLIKGLMDRKFNTAARSLLEKLILTGEPQSWDVGTARHRLINLLSEKEGSRASDLLANQMIDVAATSRYYPNASSYTYYPYQFWLKRFDKHLLANDVPPAVMALEQALKIRPCSATVAEDYLPRLRKVPGGMEPANRLFEQIRNEFLSRLEKFPDSGLFNNNLAWICTTNQMHLEEALIHAERVAKNEPDNPTYLDTLADVCFNLGQNDRAVELMKRCRRLNPDSEHYKQQLARFQGKDNEEELDSNE